MVSFDELVINKDTNPAWKMSGVNIPGFNIPQFNSITCYTVDNSTTVTYKFNGATVATLNVVDDGAGTVEVTKT